MSYRRVWGEVFTCLYRPTLIATPVHLIHVHEMMCQLGRAGNCVFLPVLQPEVQCLIIQNKPTESLTATIALLQTQAVARATVLVYTVQFPYNESYRAAKH